MFSCLDLQQQLQEEISEKQKYHEELLNCQKQLRLIELNHKDLNEKYTESLGNLKEQSQHYREIHEQYEITLNDLERANDREEEHQNENKRLIQALNDLEDEYELLADKFKDSEEKSQSKTFF